jgi:hypothetical protein
MKHAYVHSYALHGSKGDKKESEEIPKDLSRHIFILDEFKA